MNVVLRVGDVDTRRRERAPHLKTQVTGHRPLVGRVGHPGSQVEIQGLSSKPASATAGAGSASSLGCWAAARRAAAARRGSTS